MFMTYYHTNELSKTNLQRVTTECYQADEQHTHPHRFVEAQFAGPMTQRSGTIEDLYYDLLTSCRLPEEIHISLPDGAPVVVSQKPLARLFG
jgi:hypothetical protein